MGNTLTMAFFERQNLGRLYVIRMSLPGDTIIYKIGMTHSARSTDRMMEILRSWFQAYRFVPYAELRLDMACKDAGKLEKYIHTLLKDNQFIPDIKVDGGTEMFIEINELRVIQFLRAYNASNYTSPPELGESGRQVINRLLTQ